MKPAVGAIQLTALTSHPEARGRLYCFPPAASGPEYFASWSTGLPAMIDVVAVDLPGRGRRTDEPALLGIRQMAGWIASLITADARDRGDELYALAGHSFGGLLAFETARALRELGAGPALLMVSATPAPWLELPRHHAVGSLTSGIAPLLTILDLPPISGAPDPQLVQGLYLPLLADTIASLQHVYRDEPPLALPISVFGGSDDPLVPLDSLDAWGKHTTLAPAVRVFAGDHQYLTANLPEVLRALTADLLAAWRNWKG
ncbi:alpha/beta fold hydrolase [Kribbella sp. NPDC056861]|uniref:thioesterase II family protein n=1 Tax=Kribbella sp. NPDC056861 TaxID=3154857 RepID=UPI00341C0EF3